MSGTLIYPWVMKPEGKVTSQISAQGQQELSNSSIRKLSIFLGKYSTEAE